MRLAWLCRRIRQLGQTRASPKHPPLSNSVERTYAAGSATPRGFSFPNIRSGHQDRHWLSLIPRRQRLPTRFELSLEVGISSPFLSGRLPKSEARCAAVLVDELDANVAQKCRILPTWYGHFLGFYCRNRVRFAKSMYSPMPTGIIHRYVAAALSSRRQSANFRNAVCFALKARFSVPIQLAQLGQQSPNCFRRPLLLVVRHCFRCGRRTRGSPNRRKTYLISANGRERGAGSRTPN